ncbi:hypothetical protein OIU74_026518, partial [Salix koriyanagi]
MISCSKCFPSYVSRSSNRVSNPILESFLCMDLISVIGFLSYSPSLFYKKFLYVRSSLFASLYYFIYAS